MASQSSTSDVQCLVIAKEVGNRSGEGLVYGGLGIAYTALGDFSKGIEYYVQDLAIAKEVVDRAVQGKAYGSLSIVYDLLADFSKAIEYHACHNVRHLSIAKEVVDRG